MVDEYANTWTIGSHPLEVPAPRTWFERCDFSSTLMPRPDLVGRDLSQVQRREQPQGRSVRAVGKNGKCLVRADRIDNRHRVNVFLSGSRVVAAQMG